MPSYIYQPELPYGLPTTSQVQSFHTLPDTPANELERMVQGLSHGLPSTDTDAVMEDDTIDPMFIDDDPGQVWHGLLDLIRGEVTYGLIETHIDGQAGFVPVAKVIVGKPNLHGVWGVASDSIRRCLDLWGLEEFDVEIEYWGAKEHVAGDAQEGFSEPWNLPLDDLLLDFCQNGDNYATSCVGRPTPQTTIPLRFIQRRVDSGWKL